MRKLLRRLASLFCLTSSYHVSAWYFDNAKSSKSTLSMTVTIRPWLNVDNYDELMKLLQAEAKLQEPDMLIITCITKLGA